MKINQPVINRETDYPLEFNILSTTNLKGAITCCNDDFIKVSGFSLHELRGRNHNIVRHLDMPPAAKATRPTKSASKSAKRPTICSS